MKTFFRTLSEIRQLLRRPKGNSITFSVCPVCFSDVKCLPSFLSFIAPPIYYCEYCGYKGPIFAEISLDSENPDPTDLKHKQKEET
ncbi:MAG: hypothetical protein ACFFE8_14430 [Candidatus Heimdallarchaeota archaeon]